MHLKEPLLDCLLHVTARWRLARCQLLHRPEHVVLHVVVDGEGLPALFDLPGAMCTRLVVSHGDLVILLREESPAAPVAVGDWGGCAHILHVAGLRADTPAPVSRHDQSVEACRIAVPIAIPCSVGWRLGRPFEDLQGFGSVDRASLKATCCGAGPGVAAHGAVVASEELAPVRQKVPAEAGLVLRGDLDHLHGGAIGTNFCRRFLHILDRSASVPWIRNPTRRWGVLTVLQGMAQAGAQVVHGLEGPPPGAVLLPGVCPIHRGCGHNRTS
mmetsp:Transcript_36629/g.101722  ORF Transcript_36629/g.101722 Transcript_36629/m.101722 type:complete len:271 (+) Transcript_36629:670-1482(+)